MEDEDDDTPGGDAGGYGMALDPSSPRAPHLHTQVSHLQMTPRRFSGRSANPLDRGISGPIAVRELSNAAAFDGSRPVEPTTAMRDRITSTLGSPGNEVRLSSPIFNVSGRLDWRSSQLQADLPLMISS